jgi:hypothetical protein
MMIRITTDKSIIFDHNLDINLIHEIDLDVNFLFFFIFSFYLQIFQIM